MELVRDGDGVLTLVINAHGSAAPMYVVKPAVIPTVGPCVCFYKVVQPETIDGEDKRHLLLTLSRGGCVGLLRFLPALMNDASRLERKSRKSRL